MTRLERLEKLEAAGRWKTADQGLLGLPKVRSIKVALKKKKKKVEEGAEATAGDDAKTAAAPAAAAPAPKKK